MEIRKSGSVRDLNVYKVSFDSAMKIFHLTKDFPREERFSLIDQVRRSSRSICANLAEAWRKRRYRAAFINKLTECEQEAAETQTWLEFSLACGYIGQDIFDELFDRYEHIYTMLTNMERKSEIFCKVNL